MLIEIFLAIIVGILAGTLTGLIPGVHINLIGAFLISLTASIYLNPVYSITFITAMAITHTFVDFIPSIFLGCPDTDTELSVLPGHELLKNKKGFEAIYLSNKGSLIAIFILIIIIIPSIFLIQNTYDFIKNIIPYILIIISIGLILTENKKLRALQIFLLTGFLGYSIQQLDFTQPLFPLLTGLFGASNLIISLKNKTKIPEQIITKPKIKLKRPILGAIFSAPFCSFLPGIGSGQAAVIGSTIAKPTQKQFLVLLGITNTLVMGFSFISLYVIGKTRTGAALAIKEIIFNIKTPHLILIMATIFIAGISAYFLTEYLAKYFSKNFQKINYSILSYITLTILTTLVITISGTIGFLVFILSTATGIYAINQKVRRTNMMGCLIIPTIIFYLF